MASASCTIWTFLFCHFSPIIRIPKPGPGNGCLYTRLSGIPSSSPTLRTSSLNKRRSGSIISLKVHKIRKTTNIVMRFDNSRLLQSPLSTTSGYIVPCARKSTTPTFCLLFKYSYKFLTNNLPFFLSGSITPSNFL